MHHLPRSTFSDRQHGMVAWALRTHSVAHVPSELIIKSVMKSLQFACRIKTKCYEGVLGHQYYVNDVLGIIAQELANPLVWEHLHFYLEVSDQVSNAFQAHRWLYELDPNLLTPVF